MSAMLRVRAAFDPLGLCNPGKIIPMLRGCGEGRADRRAFTEWLHGHFGTGNGTARDSANRRGSQRIQFGRCGGANR